MWGVQKYYEVANSGITKGLSIYQESKYSDSDGRKNEVREVDLENLAVSVNMSCNYCKVSFEDTADQRAHYKLDWHRYNLKQALLNRPSTTAEDFDNAADDVSSISGSESESSEDEEETDIEDACLNLRDAKIYWKNSSEDVFSLHKCLILGRREIVSGTELQSRLCKFIGIPQKWLIVMLGGGHFAAAVFHGSAVTVHKTFHSYTVRAKQGGGQASRDSRGGNHPKSAGASLRRYNELAQIQHIQSIMSQWALEIAECSLILYRAVGPHNRSALFGGKTPPIAKDDPRVRPIPFPTRRATFKEVKRAHELLASINSHGSAVEFEQVMLDRSKQTNTASDGLKTKKNSPKKVYQIKEKSPKVREIPGSELLEEDDSDSGGSVECLTNDIEIDFSTLKEFDNTLKKKKKRKRVTAKQKANLVKKRVDDFKDALIGDFVKSCETGNVTHLQELIEAAESWPSREGDGDPQPAHDTLRKEDFWECFRGVVCNESQDTLLHVAARSNQAASVAALLQAGCDPSLRNKRKLPPYVLAGEKNTKNAFKEFAALFPDKFDQNATLIPPPLTEEEEKLQSERKKERRRIQKEREKVKKEEEQQKKIAEDDRIRFLALSDREKRALAAERRMIKAVASNASKAPVPVFVRCFLCGTDITGKVPFEYNCQLFCTIVCLKTHRNKPQAKK